MPRRESRQASAAAAASCFDNDIVGPLDLHRQAGGRADAVGDRDARRRASASGAAAAVRQITETYSPAPGGENHCRPKRPRPAVCAHATTVVPSVRTVFGQRGGDVVGRPGFGEEVERLAERAAVGARFELKAQPSAPAVDGSDIRLRRHAAALAGSRLELEAQVDRRRRVRQRADRHVVGAGRRQLGNPIQRDAAGELDLRAAARSGEPPRGSSAIDRLSTRMTSAPAASASSTWSRLCASISIGISWLRRFHLAHRLRDAAGETDVVVLDQDAVVEAAAVVGAAAGAHRVLLERAQRRRRLARVEDR